MSLSAAKSRVMQAKMQLESGRADDVEATLEAAERFLEGLPDEEADPVRNELRAIRVTLATLPKPEDVRNLSAAGGKIRQAKAQIGDRQYMLVADTLAGAERYLVSVPESMKTELVAEISSLRAQLRNALEAPSVSTSDAVVRSSASQPRESHPISGRADVDELTPPNGRDVTGAAKSTELSDDDRANLSRGKSRVAQARSLLESGRTENIDAVLDEASVFLAGLPASDSEDLVNAIAAIREQTKEAIEGKATRRLQDELDRKFSGAESDIASLDFAHGTALLNDVEERLAAYDVWQAFSVQAIAKNRNRLAELRAELTEALKCDTLKRVLPIIDELEHRVGGDLFVGLEQEAAYRVTRELESLQGRARALLSALSEGDADVRAIEARLVGFAQKIDKAAAAWGQAAVDAAVGNSWSVIEDAIMGWDKEGLEVSIHPLAEPDFPKTRRAIQRIRFLLESPETQRIRSEHAGDTAIEATYIAAERVFEAASAKLNAAYSAVLDNAETMETPRSRFILDSAARLAFSAESAFAGTRYLEATVSRARKLDERWKAEVAAIAKQRQTLCEQRSAEASANWPGLLLITGATALDVHHPVTGSTVQIAGVYNRFGWDFAGAGYDFATRLDGVVLAGAWAPHVMRALEHAWYELKIDVSDRLPWDLVAVIEGRDKIGVRTTVTLRDKFTQAELGKVEEWPPVDCVRLRIIALHAGPVAVAT